MKPETLARIVLFLLMAAAGFAGAAAVLAPRGADYELLAMTPENGGWSYETLHAQVGQPLRLRLSSGDVLHSFAVGQTDIPPVDLTPGEWRETTLVFDKPGRYTFYCTRWCGRSHWRMRGTILVASEEETGETGAGPEAGQPLYLRLGLDLDAPRQAEAVPAGRPSAERGAQYAGRLPAWALERQAYLESSPAQLWLRLRAEPALLDLDDDALWDAAAFLYRRQAAPEAAAELYAVNCAACHGESGRGDGVMVEGLPRFDPASPHADASAHAGEPAPGAMSPGEMSLGEISPGDISPGLSAPPDFTDPRVLASASPALLEGKLLRGGMGTGMPYWGPIFTQEQLDALVAYLYTFLFSE